MEMKRRECERETKEEEHNKEDSIHTIVFTAGTFLLMVCLKHFLVEQWRAWVFLILNVILLAILFMSMRPACSESESSVEKVKSDNKEKKRPSGGSQETEEGKECYIKQCWSSASSTYVHVQNETEEDEEEEEEEEEEQVPVLSKEELNERVEAFIAMFRQHLIKDVKQAENFRLHKIEVSCC
ncbi:major centromere autoantigen B [Spatholobus suberectus]|nr:major centromere autoantigen B [Spatholobus suberectus]